MHSTLLPTDISNIPSLVKLSEEVRKSKIPRLLKLDDQALAVLMPLGGKVAEKKKRKKTLANYKAFRAAAGSWKELDTDTLLENIAKDRRQTSSHPPVIL